MFELTPYERRHQRALFNPFRDMENFEKNFWGDMAATDFKTDIKDNGKEYVLEAELPGFKKEDIHVDIEDGYMTIKVKTPCMITCIKELNTPRYLSVGGAFECYSKPLVTMTYETLKDHPLIDKSTIGLAGSPTNILTSFTPPQKGAGMMLEGADKATTDKLAGILAAKHII